MEKNNKISNTKREINLFYIKKLYVDALYYNLIANGCKPQIAKKKIKDMY